MAEFHGKRLSQISTGKVQIPFNGGTYKCMEQGAVVREGIEKSSTKVGDLAGFADLIVVEKAVASCGTERLRIAEPLKGWVSAKIIEFTKSSHGAAAPNGPPSLLDAATAAAGPEPTPLQAASVKALERHHAAQQNPNVEYQFLKGIDYSPGGDSQTGFFVATSDDGFLDSDGDMDVMTRENAFPDSGDDASENGALYRISSGNLEVPETMPRISSGNIENPASAFPRFGSGNLEVPVVEQDYEVVPTPIKTPQPPPQRSIKEHTFASMIKCCYSASSPATKAAFSPAP